MRQSSTNKNLSEALFRRSIHAQREGSGDELEDGKRWRGSRCGDGQKMRALGAGLGCGSARRRLRSVGVYWTPPIRGGRDSSQAPATFLFLILRPVLVQIEAQAHIVALSLFSPSTPPLSHCDTVFCLGSNGWSSSRTTPIPNHR